MILMYYNATDHAENIAEQVVRTVTVIAPTPTPTPSPSPSPTSTLSPSPTPEPQDRIKFAQLGNVVSAKLIFEKTSPPPQEDIQLYVAYKENGILKRVEILKLTDMIASFIIPERFTNCDITVYVWDKDIQPLMDVQKIW